MTVFVQVGLADHLEVFAAGPMAVLWPIFKGRDRRNI